MNNIKDITTVELNAILYYADFMSLQTKGIPVTDTCKYFFVYNTPINSAYIAEVKPFYDENNKFFIQAKEEYSILKEKLGDKGVQSFIDNICSIQACGKVSGEDMLRCIHRYSNKKEKEYALNKYKKYMNNLKYNHTIKTDDGKSSTTVCSKYIAHYENAEGLGTRPELSKSNDEIN